MEAACEGILSTKDSLFPTVSADWAVLPRESNRGALMGVEEQRESLKRLCPSPCEALSDEAPCVSREARPVPRTGGTKTPCQIPLRRERPTAQCSTSLQKACDGMRSARAFSIECSLPALFQGRNRINRPEGISPTRRGIRHDVKCGPQGTASTPGPTGRHPLLHAFRTKTRRSIHDRQHDQEARGA